MSTIGFQASNQYRVKLFSFGSLVGLEARSGGVAAIYVVAGRTGAGRIEARFGDLGRISGTIERRPPRPGAECELERTVVFRGSLHFRGERGYTRVRARRASGRMIGFPLSRDCFESEERGRAAAISAAARHKPPVDPFGAHTRLFAIDKGKHRVASIEVAGFRFWKGLLLKAQMQERRGAMAIERTASAQIGGRNSFISSAAGVEPRFAFLRPPKPFSGTATFTGIDPATSTWTGSLSAWLPGLGPVRFAGPRFSSSLCRHASDERGCPRMPTVQRP